MEDPATAAGYANILYPVKNAEAVNKGDMPPDQLGVRAVDDHTFEVTLNAPTPYFLQLLTHQSSYPLHEKSVEELGDDFSKPGNLISNGAYMLQEFTPNDKIVLVKNPYFHDAANVAIDEVVYYPMQDRSACLRRFEAGEIQSCSDVPTEQMAYMKENLGDQLRIAPYLGTYYYAVDMRQPPFDDVRVRTALSEAVDREFLADEIWASAMVPAYSFVPPGIDNYGEPAMLPFADTPMLDREDDAKRLLAEAGYGPDHPLQLELRHNIGENHKNTATAIADMWKQIGVDVTIAAFEGASYYPYLQQGGAFQVARAGWIADYSDPQNFLFMLESDNTAFNYAHYNNPDYDALMDKAAAEGDIDKRAEYLNQAEQLEIRDEPFIPLMYYGSLSLVSDKLHGWQDNIQNAHLTRWMSLDQ
jgi:oligopeptide transport system substrate-binding protein